MKGRPLRALVAGLALLAPLLAGCGNEDGRSGGGGAKRSVAVNIASFKFLPKRVKLEVGGTVTWTNHDRAPHTAESEEGAPSAFDTRRLDLGESKAITIAKPGRYSYFCRFHRFMVGTVEVVE